MDNSTNLKEWFNSLPYTFYFDDPSSARSKLYNRIKKEWNSELAMELNNYLCKDDRYNKEKNYF